MLRASAVTIAFGVVGAFRVDQEGRKVATAVGPPVQRNFCSLSGDPHVLGFDQQWKGGARYDPMHAEGHYWLVKTETGKISVQGTYGACGQKQGSNWMAIRKNGRPRTCLTGVAVSGSFLGGSRTLVVEAPCDWDWDTQKCRNTDTKQPRITWMGARVNSVPLDGGVTVSSTGTNVKVILPENVQIDLMMAGNWGSSASFTYMNAQIWMVQGSGGKQCGHCGSYDGNPSNDQIYEETGGLKGMTDASKGSLCDPKVGCMDRLISGGVECQTTTMSTTKPTATTTTTSEGCSKEDLDRAEDLCRKKFEDAIDPKMASKIPVDISVDELKECVLDVCLGGKGFAGDDAKDAATEDAAMIKAGIMAR